MSTRYHCDEHHTRDKISIVRADNSKGEFGIRFQNSLIAQSIEFELCPLYKHIMNSIIKHTIYTINYKARSLLFESSLAGEF
jgi:hypothetical protein